MHTHLDFATMAELTHPSHYNMSQAVIMFSAAKLQTEIMQYGWANPGFAQILQCTHATPDFFVEWILSILPACLSSVEAGQLHDEITIILSGITVHLEQTNQHMIITRPEFNAIIGALIDRVISDIMVFSPAFVREINGRNIHSFLRISDTLYKVVYV